MKSSGHVTPCERFSCNCSPLYLVWQAGDLRDVGKLRKVRKPGPRWASHTHCIEAGSVLPAAHSRRIPETLTAPTLQLCSLSLCLPTHGVPTSLPKKLLSLSNFWQKLTLLGSQSLSMIAPPTFHLCFPSHTLNGVVSRKGFSLRLHQVLAV